MTDNTVAKRWKIPKQYSEAVNHRTDNTMAKSLKIPKEYVFKSRESQDRQHNGEKFEDTKRVCIQKT